MEPQPDWIETLVRQRVEALKAKNDWLCDENAQLRTLIVEALRAMKEVELVLRKALDKDKKQS